MLDEQQWRRATRRCHRSAAVPTSDHLYYDEGEHSDAYNGAYEQEEEDADEEDPMPSEAELRNMQVPELKVCVHACKTPPKMHALP